MSQERNKNGIKAFGYYKMLAEEEIGVQVFNLEIVFEIRQINKVMDLKSIVIKKKRSIRIISILNLNLKIKSKILTQKVQNFSITKVYIYISQMTEIDFHLNLEFRQREFLGTYDFRVSEF